MVINQSFLVGTTLAAYVVARWLYRRYNIVPFFPLITAPCAIILVMYLSKTSVETYQESNKLISFLVGPATVAFAVPLYRQWSKIKANWLAILAGIVAGSFTGLVSVVLAAKYLGAGTVVTMSLAAKSTSIPIAVEVTRQLQGIEAISIFSVVATAIIGGAIGPEFLRLVRVKDPVAIGLALGTAAHASGTARAFQLGEVEGSFSGAAIVLAGLATALMAPWIIPYLV